MDSYQHTMSKYFNKLDCLRNMRSTGPYLMDLSKYGLRSVSLKYQYIQKAKEFRIRSHQENLCYYFNRCESENNSLGLSSEVVSITPRDDNNTNYGNVSINKGNLNETFT